MLNKYHTLVILLAILLNSAAKVASQPSMNVLPTPSQVQWADAEIGVIIHLDINIYSPDSFNYRRKETLPSLQVFRPSNLNTDQWIKAAQSAGAKYAVLVAKHGTGFCLWPSKVHDYTVAGTPWKNGKGDIVADFIKSCKKYGVRPGIYYSTGSNTYYGVHNDNFFSSDARQSFNKMMLQQLTELWTRYGKLFEIWFDGGVLPSAKGGIADDVTKMIKRYQPEALLFQGPGACNNLVRWVGNEAGKAPYPMWSRADTTTSSNGIVEIKNLHGNPDGPIWCPAESDFPNRKQSAWQGGWLWKANQEDKVLSVQDLVKLYYSTVGNNSNMLIGMAIDTAGTFPEKDAEYFAAFGKEISSRYRKSLGETHGSGNEIILNLGNKPIEINELVLMEDISKGENIRKYVIHAWLDNAWKPVSEGISVGHKRLHQFSAVSTTKLRCIVSESVQTPVIKKMAVYKVG
jgi:alpha-L-fucosidase